MFLNTVMIVQHCLGGPAEGQYGEHVALGPLYVIHQFLPVFHLFKLEAFHRRPRDDKTVIIPVFDVRKLQIRFVQIGIVRMGCFPGHGTGKVHFDLQWTVSQQPQQLQLRGFLQGHQVQDQDLQRADILGHGPLLRNGDNSFFLQVFHCRQLVCDFHRHFGSSLRL